MNCLTEVNGKDIVDLFNKGVRTFTGYRIMGGDFRDLDLSFCTFHHCRIESVNFCGTNLYNTTFKSCEFYFTKTSDSTNFYCTRFLFCDLAGEVFRGMEISPDAFYLCNISPHTFPSIDTSKMPIVCPETGSFTAWKKCYSCCGYCLVELVIPKKAKRVSSAFTRESTNDEVKCRANMAIVKHIYLMDGTLGLHDELTAYSIWDNTFEYKVGTTVKPKDKFDNDRRAVCSSGIHFFMTKEEALRYS